jgi:MFS family permease
MLGRRRSMLLSVAIFCIGAILQVSAEASANLLAGRWVSLPHPQSTSPLFPHIRSDLFLAPNLYVETDLFPSDAWLVLALEPCQS